MKITVILARGKSAQDVASDIQTKLSQLTGKQCRVIIRKDNSRLNNIIKGSK